MDVIRVDSLINALALSGLMLTPQQLDEAIARSLEAELASQDHDRRQRQLAADEALAKHLLMGEDPTGHLLADEELARRLEAELNGPSEQNLAPGHCRVDGGLIRGACPHCGGDVEVPRDQVNCRIFRHGTDGEGNQVPQHCTAEEALRLTKAGCSRQFVLSGDAPAFRLEACEGR